ncbi:PREDICTED: putative F-box protein At3g20030 [Camelina sativa]|uniref:F-box protein At3g20030 n=1 Tax=Camelina sativa TaxID=90675 RepID=A0ABM1QZR3_CAMSA|nr:PREDICTED: putative F-box protein At3g20030 [Camelina sativa]
MTTIADLPKELVENILSMVPITSLGAVRSTCKRWNALSKEKILCKAEQKHQFLGFMMKKYKLCSVRFDIEGEEFADPCIKELDCNGVLRDQEVEEALEVSNVFQCDGLVLCATRDHSKLVVWNPYLGQTRWIQPRNSSTPYHRLDRYAIGCDNNRKHKILRSSYDFERGGSFGYEIYDLSSNSWRVITTPDWHIDYFQRGASLKGNTYFLATQAILKPSESFGQTFPLPLDYYSDVDTGALSSLVGDQKLAFLFQGQNGTVVEIWVTTSMIPNAASVSWIPFLKIDMEPHYGFLFYVCPAGGSFFIDEEKKLAVVIDYDESELTRHEDSAYVIGDNGSYVPSLAQIN